MITKAQSVIVLFREPREHLVNVARFLWSFGGRIKCYDTNNNSFNIANSQKAWKTNSLRSKEFGPSFQQLIGKGEIEMCSRCPQQGMVRFSYQCRRLS